MMKSDCDGAWRSLVQNRFHEVLTLTGERQVHFLHLEIQSQKKRDFSRRVYRYIHRISLTIKNAHSGSNADAHSGCETHPDASANSSANAPIELNTVAEKNQFVSSMIDLIEEYGFDGLDIDLEGSSVILNPGDTDFRNPTTPKIINFIEAMRELVSYFGPDFILTAAPETQNVQGGYGHYGTACRWISGPGRSAQSLELSR